jgi:hypothetical protein
MSAAAASLLTPLLLLVFAAHHALYYVGCRLPRVTTYPALSQTLVWHRAFSIALYAAWVWFVLLRQGAGARGGPRALLPSTALGWALGLPLVLLGQALTAASYRALGVQGIYYGRELGVLPPDAPPVRAFPYDGTVPQPLYTGAVLTLIGAFLIWGLTPTYGLRPPALPVTAALVALYGVSMTVETRCAAPPRQRQHQHQQHRPV